MCLDSRERRDLAALSSLGHFLKGSSAALGIIKVQESSAKMQQYGDLRGEGIAKSLSEGEAVGRIRDLILVMQEQIVQARAWLERFYEVRSRGLITWIEIARRYLNGLSGPSTIWEDVLQCEPQESREVSVLFVCYPLLTPYVIYFWWTSTQCQQLGYR